MASRADENEEDIGENGDAPLIDLNDATVKKLLAKAKRRGFLTYDELNAALPQDQMSSEQIEDVMSAINDMGVQIVENDEAGDDNEDDVEEEVERAIVSRAIVVMFYNTDCAHSLHHDWELKKRRKVLHAARHRQQLIGSGEKTKFYKLTFYEIWHAARKSLNKNKNVKFCDEAKRKSSGNYYRMRHETSVDLLETPP